MDEQQQELLEVFREEGEELLHAWEATCLEFGDGITEEGMNSILRTAHTLKGSSKTVGLEEFGTFVHKIEDLLKEVQGGKIPDKDKFVGVLLKTHEILGAWLESGEGDDQAVQSILSEVKTIYGSSNESGDESGEAKPASFAKNTSDTKPKDSKQSSSKNEVIRVKRDKIDDVIKTVGELGTQLSIIGHHYQDKTYDTKEATEALDFCLKYTKQLQEYSLSLSMQPLERFFQRLERTCKDVARVSKKTINIEKVGSYIELDKTVLDRIADPFVHIIRNAADHGIENGPERLTAGKAEAGTVTLKAEQDAGMVKITISDDGKGLDKERILEKAKEKGLIQEGQTVSDNEIYQMILLPGFSTNEVVTEVSGRGVGMDVVNSTLADLGGSLTIESKKGFGSSFVVSLPTNFSLMEAIVVTVDGILYGIPLKDFSEIIDLNELKRQTNEAGESFFSLRGEVISLHNIDDFLKIKKNGGDSDNTVAALVNRNAHKPMAFCIERLLGRQSLFVKPLEGNMDSMLGVSGTTILPDGKAGLVLNLTDIVRDYHLQFKDGTNG